MPTASTLRISPVCRNPLAYDPTGSFVFMPYQCRCQIIQRLSANIPLLCIKDNGAVLSSRLQLSFHPEHCATKVSLFFRFWNFRIAISESMILLLQPRQYTQWWYSDWLLPYPFNFLSYFNIIRGTGIIRTFSYPVQAVMHPIQLYVWFCAPANRKNVFPVQSRIREAHCPNATCRRRWSRFSER